MMRNWLNLFIIIFIISNSAAQMPDTEIWVFELAKNDAGKTVIKEGRNLTNRTGYDNQPAFSPDGKFIFYSSVREDKQSDIYKVKARGGEAIRVTNSKESEYSPQFYAHTKLLSSVVVEKDSAQRIHFIDPETGIHTSKLDFDSVGYCLFLNADTVIYYKLTAPHSLRYYSRSTGEDRFLCNSPVRSIKFINRHCVLYGTKDSTGCVFYQYDFLLRKAEKIGSSTNQDEDIYWHPEWGLLMARESRILQFDRRSGTWSTLFDLGSFGLKKAGRFCFDMKGKFLAVVEIK